MTVRIAPSLLAADFARLAEEVGDVQRAGADMLHLDIMDGHFVPNLSFGPPVVRAIAAHATVPLDAHLMVDDPGSLIPDLATAGVARVAVHVESCPHIHRTVSRIRDEGMEAGVAVNPGTALESLTAILPCVDFVLVMSVNPGLGGQHFIAESLERVRQLRQTAGAENLDIEVDGGVGPANAGALAAAGATILVAGSSVFGAPDRGQALAAIRRKASGGEV